jgi:hypothetical protein
MTKFFMLSSEKNESFDKFVEIYEDLKQVFDYFYDPINFLLNDDCPSLENTFLLPKK